METSSTALYNHLIDFFGDKEQILKVSPKSLLFQEKDPVKHIYLIIDGSISVGRIHLKGKEFIVKILHNHEILWEYQLFKPNSYYHCYAKTLSECQLLPIPKEQFEEFIRNDPQATELLVQLLSTSYVKAQQKCMDLIMNGKKGGLYSILIRLCNSYGIVTKDGILIDLPITHQELANLTYGTREVIQRTLKDLREKNVIMYDQQRFTIKNLQYLRQAVDCQNCGSEVCGLN